MTTIANVIDRIYRDYLTAPGEQHSRFLVAGAGIDNNPATTTLPVDTALLSPEEQDIIGPGTLIEVGSEIMLVEQVTGDPPTSLEVRRQMLGTDIAAHAAGDEAFIASDDYTPRKTVFDAVADAIDNLWPDLYTIQVEELSTSANPLELPEGAKEVIDIRASYGGKWVRAGSWDEIHDFPLVASGVAVQVKGLIDSVPIHIYYKKAASRPAAETDTLADLGVSESWVKVIAVMAAAQAISNKDLDEATIEFITHALDVEGFGIGQGANIRNSLVQYGNFLMAPLKRALHVSHRDRVVIDRSY